MNKNIKDTFRIGLIAAAGFVAMNSCSDTWDEHYDSEISRTYNGTLMSGIASNPELSDFAEILKATGYDVELADEQVYTVWAPVNNSFNKDSLLDLIKDGEKQNVISRFVKNHISRYNHSLSSTPQDVTFLNTKKDQMGAGKIGGVEIKDANLTCNNGVLHIVSDKIPYFANIYEQIQIDFHDYLKLHNLTEQDSVPSLYTFLKGYDKDSLDEARSVYRGVDENGNRVYVDSVTIFKNQALSGLRALLYEEDSSYVAIVPTPEAYKQRYEEVLPYLNYHNMEDANKNDSLRLFYANRLAVNDLFFNMNQNTHPQDSLMASTYSRLNWEYDVFYEPYGADGIFSKIDTNAGVICSNGTVYNTTEWPVSIYDSFFRRIKLEAEYSSNQEASEEYTKLCTTGLYAPSGEGYSNYLLDVIPTSSAVNPIVTFKIPNTFSGEYDFYVVTAPLAEKTMLSTDSTKSYIFRANLFEKNNREYSFFTSTGKAISAVHNFTSIDADGKSSRNFTTKPAEIDTVYLGSYKLENCYYGSNIDAGVMLQIQSYATTAQVRNNQASREMLIDCIILKPHRTEDE